MELRSGLKYTSVASNSLCNGGCLELGISLLSSHKLGLQVSSIMPGLKPIVIERERNVFLSLTKTQNSKFLLNR